MLLDLPLFLVMQHTGLFYLWHYDFGYYSERIANTHEYFPIAFPTFLDAALEATALYAEDADPYFCA